jgi:hypothetical protein
MKRPNSTRSLLTIDCGIPAYWSPDQALAVLELLDGLREFIAERYGMHRFDAFRKHHLPGSSDPDPDDQPF